MTAFLTYLFGRLPIGWLQLNHNKMRFAAALAGVSFANILVFVQLGFLGALTGSIAFPYRMMNADILVQASDANTMEDGSPLPRQRLFQALATPGVASATAVYLNKLEWKQEDGTIRTLDVFGIDPSVEPFKSSELVSARNQLQLADTAILDRRTRNVPKEIFTKVDGGTAHVFEANNRSISIVGTFTVGGGFAADGYMIVSDQTFLKIFKQRSSGAPNFVFVRINPGANVQSVIDRLRNNLSPLDSSVVTIEEAISKDVTFQTTQKPVGFIFGFGVIIGTIVGLIIVYQVLSTDVADHIREYATFKAIGYPQSFFLGIVFEEALILAILGFIPGVIISIGLYAIVATATGLPLSMPFQRAAYVLIGTIVMSSISGMIATRKLARANPADLF